MEVKASIIADKQPKITLPKGFKIIKNKPWDWRVVCTEKKIMQVIDIAKEFCLNCRFRKAGAV